MSSKRYSSIFRSNQMDIKNKEDCRYLDIMWPPLPVNDSRRPWTLTSVMLWTIQCVRCTYKTKRPFPSFIEFSTRAHNWFPLGSGAEGERKGFSFTSTFPTNYCCHWLPAKMVNGWTGAPCLNVWCVSRVIHYLAKSIMVLIKKQQQRIGR